MTYSTFDVPVTGGLLRVGRWQGETPDSPRVLALHGITAHHLTWPLLAAALPEVDVVAPDLRGRGRSRDLPAEVGLVAHAEDAAAVIRAVGGPVTVVGHSMGGFVATVLAHRYPELVSGVVLVDGGLPFADVDQEATLAGLELIKARLRATYPSPEAYVDLFRRHPAFVDDWSDVTAMYARYDVVGEPPECRASAVVEAVLADQQDVMGSTAHREAVEALAAGSPAVPWTFLRAPRGFVDDPPGLYGPEAVDAFRERFPRVAFREVEDVNHYTIVFAERGVRAVAEAVRGQIR